MERYSGKVRTIKYGVVDAYVLADAEGGYTAMPADPALPVRQAPSPGEPEAGSIQAAFDALRRALDS